MDDTYFDFLGGDDTFMGHVMGFVFFPVLFPLYLSLKLLTGAIEYLEDVISGIVDNMKKPNKDVTLEETLEENPKIKEIENKITTLKAEKARVEKQIKAQKPSSNQEVNSFEEDLTDGMVLKRK